MIRLRHGVAFAVAVSLGGAAGPAFSRSSVLVSYRLADVWPSAVRFLRVDRSYTIREKDESSGYILFELREGQKIYSGSLELIATTDSEGREATRTAISLPDLPRHFETMLLDKLGDKLKEERGAPAPPPPKKPPDDAPAKAPGKDGEHLPGAPKK